MTSFTRAWKPFLLKVHVFVIFWGVDIFPVLSNGSFFDILGCCNASLAGDIFSITLWLALIKDKSLMFGLNGFGLRDQGKKSQWFV